MSTPAVHKEPVLRIAKRDGLPHWKGWLIRVAAVVLALLEDYVWDWFMYLFGLVLISVGALYLAQSRSGSEGKAVGKR